jgi:hypothetical protein
MLHPALWKLIRLMWRGAFRQMRSSLKTVRGVFFFGFIIAMSLYGLGSLYVASMFASQSQQFSGTIGQMRDDFLPIGLFCFTCYVILFSTGESTVYFTASEAAFLFPAPISRKQLLTYSLVKSVLGMSAVSFLFALFSSPGFALVIPRWMAIALTLLFLQLLTMNVAFIRHILQEKIRAQVRQAVSVLVGIVVLVALFQATKQLGDGDLQSIWKAFRYSTAATWVLAPFQVFVRALSAEDWVSFLPYAGILLLIDLVLLQIAYRMDALSLEASLAISEKMTAKIKMMQAKGVAGAFGPSNSSVARRRFPQLPFWGGIGPVVWQRMTTTFRVSNRLLWLLAGVVAVAGSVVYFVGKNDKSNGMIAPIMGMGAMAYSSFLLSLMIQNEIERVGYMKSLPIRSVAIVIGDWIGFPILLSIIQSLFITGVACFYPTVAPWLLAGAALTLPLNLLLFGIDKLVFYIYPTRMAKGAPGDFQNAGKQMVFMALKMLMLGGGVLIVVLAALPGALALHSPLVAVLSAAVVLGIECVALVPLLVIAFDRFDPGITYAG